MPLLPAKKTSRAVLEKELIKEVRALQKDARDLSKEVGNLKNLEFVKILKHPWKFMGLSLMKGIMVGFGSVLGATVLVALFVYLLAKISLVPIVGDFVKDIMIQIEGTKQTETEDQTDEIYFEQNDEADLEK